VATGIILKYTRVGDTFKNTLDGTLSTDPEGGVADVILKDPSLYGSNTSLTDNISRDFFLNYVDLEAKGEWDVDKQAALIENLTTKYSSTTVPTVTATSLATFSDREKDKTKIYGNALITIINSYGASVTQNPMDILAVAAENNDPSLLARLKPIAETYLRIAIELQKLEVPASQAPTHAEIINTYIRMSESVHNMSFYNSDSLRAFLGLTTYQQTFVTFVDLLKNTANYFKTNAILFSNTEEGSVWSKLTE
jgi:hypothetical protein